MWQIEEVTMYRVYSDVTGEYVDDMFETEAEAEDCIKELQGEAEYVEMVRNERW